MRKSVNSGNKRFLLKFHNIFTDSGYRLIVFMGAFAIIGTALLVFSKAATPTASIESESGQLNGPVISAINDSSASGGSFVKFNQIKPQIKGVVDRDPYNFTRPTSLQNVDIPAEYESIVNNFVLLINWDQIQHTSQNELNTTFIDDAISEAKAKNMHIKLRVLAGIHAPDWVKTMDGGPFNVYDVDQTTGEVFTGTSPKYWTESFKSSYSNLMQKLSDKYDDENTIASVANSMCSTIFAEPFIKNLGEGDNFNTFYNAGLTKTLDEQCHNNAIDIHNQVWKRTRTETAVNPLSYKDIDTNGNPIEKFDASFSIAWIDRCRQVLGSKCIFGNNGFNLVSYDANSNYRKVIGAEICQGNPPPYFQTRQYSVILSTGNTIGGVLQYAINVGAGMVELPQQYKTGGITPQALAPLDVALENNNAITCPLDRLLPNPT